MERGVEIVTVSDEGLGHFSHLVHLEDGAALVVDPARLPDHQRQLARGRGWTVSWTADTHSHADHVSGSFDLAVGPPIAAGPLTVMWGHGERAMTAASLSIGRGRAEARVLGGGPGDWSRAHNRPLVTES